MSDRVYDYKCKSCGNKDEHLISFGNRHLEQVCSVCGGKSVYQFPVEAVLGFMPFEPMYNEALGCDVHSRRELQRILRDKGVIEAGDRVHGGRNFDKHAPHHIKPLPPKGIFYEGKERIRPEWEVGIEDKDGKVHRVKEHELRTL